MTNTRDGGRTNASAHSDFLAETLKYQNRGVGSHTDGKDDTRNARQRKREQAERRKCSQKAKVEHGEHGHCSSSEQAQTVIEEQQVQHDERRPIRATMTPETSASWPKVGPTTWDWAYSKDTGSEPDSRMVCSAWRLPKSTGR